MRPLITGEAALRTAGVFAVHQELKIANGDGTLIDYTHRLTRTTITGDIDQPVTQATFSLWAETAGGQSLVPYRTNSTLNRLDDGTTYSPALDAHREVQWRIAITAVGATPTAGEWRFVFWGRIDRVNAADREITLDCRDVSGALKERWIESSIPYAQTVKLSIEANMQLVILDSWSLGAFPGLSGSTPVTLYVPTPTGYESELVDFGPLYVNVFDSLQAWGRTYNGWDVRLKWHEATSAFRLTYYDPDRAKTVPDYTLSPAQYHSVERLEIDKLSVRNAVTIRSQVAVNAPDPSVVRTVNYQDNPSIARFGRQWFGMDEGPDSPLAYVTEARLLEMATAMVNDLKDPKADHEVEMPFFWAVELHDLFRFQANARHYNVDQDLAVVGYTHELTATRMRTLLRTRGSVAGGYKSWFTNRFPGPAPSGAELPSIPIVSPVFDKDGVATLHLRGVSNTQSFRVAISTTAIPSTGDVAAAAFVNAANGEASYVVTSPASFAVGDTIYWRVRGFSEQNGVGLESPEDAVGDRPFGEVVLRFAAPQLQKLVVLEVPDPGITFPYEDGDIYHPVGTDYLEGLPLGGTAWSATATKDITALLPVGAKITKLSGSVMVKASGTHVGGSAFKFYRNSTLLLEAGQAFVGDGTWPGSWSTVTDTTFPGGEDGIVVANANYRIELTVGAGVGVNGNGRGQWVELTYILPAQGEALGSVSLNVIETGGAIDGSGTAGKLAKFTAGAVVGDSIISESGTTATVGGTLAATTLTGAGSGITALNADNLASGTVPLARLVDIANAQIAAAAAIAWTKISKVGALLSEFGGSISSAQHGDLSATDTTAQRHHWNQITNKPSIATLPVAWADVTKTGSSLADLATRAYSALTFSALTAGHVWRATTSTAASFGTLVAESFADATIAISRFANSAASGLSVIGRSANTAGPFAEINAGTDGHVLRRLGTALGFGTLASGAYADNTVAPSRLTNINQNEVIGRTTAGTGAASAIATSALTGMSAAGLTSGTVPLARLVDIANAQIAAAAAIAWTKISKAGSSLADLATRSASDLSSGTLPDARFPATLPAVSGANLTNLPFPTYPIRSGETGVTAAVYPYGDVRRYGATGSGVVVGGAITGTDDLASFNACTTAAKAFGDTILIPALAPGKFYRLSGVWLLSNASDIHVRGEGVRSLLVIANGAGANCITVSGSFHYTLENFAISGASGSGHGIEVVSASHRGKIKDVTIQWVDGDGIRITEGLSTRMFGVTLDQNNAYDLAALGGTLRGNIDNGINVMYNAAGLTTDTRCIGCTVEAGAGHNGGFGLKVGDSTAGRVDSFQWLGGLVEGLETCVYLHCQDGLIEGCYIEPPFGTISNYVVTMDRCINTVIKNGNIQGDARLLGACRQSGFENIRGCGFDISAESDACFIRDSRYKNISTGPGGGFIKDRSTNTILDNIRNTADDRVSTGFNTARDPALFFGTNMQDWVSATTTPCGFNKVGGTLTKDTGTVRTGSFSAKYVYSADLTQFLQMHLTPINMIRGKWVSVEAWVYNLTTPSLAYIGGLRNGTSTGWQPSFFANTWERMQASFYVEPGDTSFVLLFSGVTGTVFWDSIKIWVSDYTHIKSMVLDGTATPSISSSGNSGYPVPLLITSGTPTITNFLHPHVGVPFTIQFLDATQVSESAGAIDLSGSANFVGNNADTLTLVYGSDGNFYELSRSFN